MQLDMDLGREIMLAIEADPEADGTGGCKIEIPGRSSREIAYHIKQLSLADLIKAEDNTTITGFDWIATDLTPRGHEFLEESRDKGLWEKAKGTVREHGAPMTFKVLGLVLAKLAEQAVAKMMGLPS